MLKNSLGILLLVAATPAMADISYNYVDFSYQRINIDATVFDVDGDGFGIGGSFEIAEDWFVQAGYDQADFDSGIDLDQTSIGIGYKWPTSNTRDVFATLNYIRAERSTSGFGAVDDDGLGLSVGIRAMPTDNVEVNAALGYVDLDDAGDNITVSVGGLYSFNDAFALGLGTEFDDDVTSYGIFGRFYFGR